VLSSSRIDGIHQITNYRSVVCHNNEIFSYATAKASKLDRHFKISPSTWRNESKRKNDEEGDEKFDVHVTVQR